MLENTAVLAKTDLGRDAITRRTHNLSPRQRALLISINGEADVAQLVARFGAEADAARGLLAALLEQGLVEPVGAGVAAAPVPQAPGSPAEPTASAAPTTGPEVREAASGSAEPIAVITRLLESSGTAVENVVTSAAAAAGAGDWRAHQQRAGDSLHALMGAEADLLAMRLARARSQSEFESHFQRALELVDRARGPDARDDFRRAVLSG